MKDESAKPTRWWLHTALFLTTCATTFYAGCYSGGGFSLVDGAMFSSGIMGILLVHEMAHFVAARRHAVPASLPYFIPMPLPPIGTFGAVIQMKEAPRSRAAVLDIGVSGPLAGMLVAVPVCFVGLLNSEVRAISDLPAGAIMEGNSLLYLLLKAWARPDMVAGTDVFLHPLAWAGWIGLLVTSLNLLPAGQLDGGHILYALAGRRRHERVAGMVRGAVLVTGLVGLGCTLLPLAPPVESLIERFGLQGLVLRGGGMTPWIVWALLLRFVGRSHPPVHDEDQALGPGRRSLAWLALLVLALTLTPVIWSPVQP